jgi:dienelactone hydrolase
MFDRAMLKATLAALIIVTAPQFCHAQDAFFYPAPAPGTVTVMRNVQYGDSGSNDLQMDVYRPANPSGPTPVLIFFNQRVGAQRTAFTMYARWGEVAASKGVAAIVPDLRPDNSAADFRLLVAHLTSHAATYGIDRDAIAVYAGSGYVSTALPIVEDPANTAVKAAVMYYGTATVKTFRQDLPIMIVRAGLDRPALNAEIAGLAASLLAQNVPVTLLNHPAGAHSFESVNDDAATKAVIDQTIDFVKRATSAPYQSALRGGVAEATAAAFMLSGNVKAAAVAYATLVDFRPADARLRLSYGEALLGDAQFRAACDEFEKLKGKGLGPRDLGLPAARACAQTGDAVRAIAWLQSIPQRFLPADAQKDAAFASIQNRSDFQALFKR